MQYRYLILALALACGQKNTLPQQPTSKRIVVTITGGTLGTPAAPQPINFSPSSAYTVHL